MYYYFQYSWWVFKPQNQQNTYTDVKAATAQC